MQIGLIGGIGPAATNYYYQRLITEFANRNEKLDLTIVHADAHTLLHHLEHNNIDAQVEIYKHLTDRLASAGAERVVITSIAGHFCIDAFKEQSALPIINLLTEVSQTIKTRNLARVGIIGTRTVMETQFYAGIDTAEVITPTGNLLDEVHTAYATMAASGHVTDQQRTIFDTACEWLLQDAEVEAIMLGGTDLALVYKEGQAQFPVVDCAAIHVDAIVKHATG